MRKALTMDFASAEELACRLEDIASTVEANHGAVLCFPSLRPDELKGIINKVGTALPNHYVYSGGSGSPARVMITPVVSRSQVLEHRDEIMGALAEYRRLCTELVDKYRKRTLSWLWRTHEHGGHCMFRNRWTGQVVEAPFRDQWDGRTVDPYFFAIFVKSTKKHRSVAKLIEHDYFDTARMLEVLGERAPFSSDLPTGGLNYAKGGSADLGREPTA